MPVAVQPGEPVEVLPPARAALASTHPGAPHSTHCPTPPAAPCRLPDASPSRFRYLGVELDVGVPSGLAFGVAVRPGVPWVHLSLAATYAILPGMRLALTFDPLPALVSPSLSLEAGRAFSAPIPRTQARVNYDYASIQLGVEGGKRDRYRLFLRAGGSWLRGRISHLEAAVDPVAGVNLGEPRVTAFATTIKAGLVTYF